MSHLPLYLRAVRSWTVNVLLATFTFVPRGMFRGAAMVIPCFGVVPMAVIPVACGPQHILHAQYAVRMALVRIMI